MCFGDVYHQHSKALSWCMLLRRKVCWFKGIAKATRISGLNQALWSASVPFISFLQATLNTANFRQKIDIHKFLWDPKCCLKLTFLCNYACIFKNNRTWLIRIFCNEMTANSSDKMYWYLPLPFITHINTLMLAETQRVIIKTNNKQ